MTFSIYAALPAMFLSMSLVLSLPTTLNNNLVSAQSPSIVREEIPDNTDAGLELAQSENKLVPIELKNGITIFGKEAVDKSNCTLGKFRLPSIDSVSFVSDETILNSTLWLNQSFLEPPYTAEGSPFVDDSKIHQEFFSIIVFDDGKNLNQKRDDIVNQISKYNTNVSFASDVTNLTNIQGYSAYNITFTGIRTPNYPHVFGNLLYGQMNIIIANDDMVYNLVYQTDIEQFNAIKPEIQKMINSFHINNSTGSSKNDSPRIDQGDYTLYNIAADGTKIEIQYPSNWQKVEKFSGQDIVTFFSPIQGAYLHHTQYGVKLLPKTIYVIPPESTHGYIQKIYWKNSNQYWNNSLNDMSSGKAHRNIYEEKVTKFYGKGERWIHVPLRLHDINSPTDYSAFFFMNINFVKGTQYCNFGEITSAISGPLPEFNITYDPARPSIGPNQEKIVEIKIQALTNSFSHMTLSINKKDADIQSATFRDTDSDTTEIDIRPNGWNTTQLVIKGPSILKDRYDKGPLWNEINPTQAKTLEITADINSTSRLKLPGTDTISASDIDASPIQKRSSLTLDVLNSYDSILADFSALNTSGAVTIIIAIGTAIAGLVVGLFGKEKILALFK